MGPNKKWQVRLTVAVVAGFLSACGGSVGPEGPAGPTGPTGPTGKNCTVAPYDGGVTVTWVWRRYRLQS